MMKKLLAIIPAMCLLLALTGPALAVGDGGTGDWETETPPGCPHGHPNDGYGYLYRDETCCYYNCDDETEDCEYWINEEYAVKHLFRNGRCVYCAQPEPETVSGRGRILINRKNVIDEGAPVTAAKVNLGYGDLNEGSEIFSEKELKLRDRNINCSVYVTVGTAPALNSADETAVKAQMGDVTPLALVPVNVQVMKELEGMEPAALTTVTPISVTLTMDPGAVPEGASGVLIFTPAGETPVGGSFDAGSFDVTFDASTFGNMTLGFY